MDPLCFRDDFLLVIVKRNALACLHGRDAHAEADEQGTP
jgi:hypothetical protein